MNLINIKEASNKTDSTTCIGIDFGTTNSVCSLKIGDTVKSVPDQIGEILIPTIILYDAGKKYFGNQVLDKKEYFDSIFSIKRKFTNIFDKKDFTNEINEKISPIEVARDFFIFLKKLCEDYLKENVFDCVITVPAYFDERARSGIMRAAFMAGFRVRRLINEPTAAAFAYGLEKKKRGNFFVYDLGGGTFDVSLLRLSDGIFKVISTGGDANLGGDDFDELFAKFILKNKCNVLFEDLSSKEQLKLSKKFKSIKEKFVSIENVKEEIFINGDSHSISISIEEFNKSVKVLVDKTVNISSDLLKEVDMDISEINGFVMVGGSSRISYITDKLKNEFNTRIFDDINPDLVVSQGAALHGYELLNGSQNILLDVTPLSLGIETMGGLMEKIISRNSPIPAIKEQIFTTHENGQTALKIKILQGERETSDNNRTLGEFILSNIPPKPAGIPRIKVSFSLDADGMLFVSAKDEETENETDISIKTNENLDLKEMRAIVESSILNAKDDINQRMIIEAKIKAKSFLNEIKGVEKDIELLCSKNDIESINKNIIMLQKAIESNDCDIIHERIDNLNKSTEIFAQKRIEKDFSEVIGKELNDID